MIRINQTLPCLDNYFTSTCENQVLHVGVFPFALLYTVHFNMQGKLMFSCCKYIFIAHILQQTPGHAAAVAAELNSPDLAQSQDKADFKTLTDQ